MTTISDVALRAGVSAATVSRVVNETKPVSDELRLRVLRVMEELDYHPNLLAGSLRRRVTHTLGLIVPDTTNPFFGELAKSIEDVGFGNGYNVILCNSDYNLDRERSYVEVLRDKRVDGMVLIPCSANTEHIEDLLYSLEGAVVTVDRLTPNLGTDSVTADNRAGGRLAASHLAELGHRVFSCIERPEYLAHIEDRLLGFRGELEKRGMDVPPERCVCGGFYFQDGVRAGRALLEAPFRPTAIFAYNDIMAIGALQAARDLGLRVPHDVAIVGFDDIPVSSYVTPPLTTIRLPKYEMGSAAARILLDRLSGELVGPAHHEVLSVELVVRDSSAP
jgi:LacI family transcriptional regulator